MSLEAQRFQLINPLSPNTTASRAIRRLWFGDLHLNDLTEWQIKGLLPARCLAVMYGSPGCGKSFLAIDLAMRMAMGAPWFGAETTQGAVAYVAGEAGLGMQKRLIGFAKHHGREDQDIPVLLLPQATNLLSDTEVSELIAALKQAEDERGAKFDIIIIDTLSRCFGAGNENASEAMGAFVANCDRIRADLNASVMVIHHDSKDGSGKGGRGHSILLGAADTMFRVERPATGGASGTVTVEKQKDGEGGQRFWFRLAVVEAGQNASGEQILTCVVEQTDDVPEQKKKRLSPRLQRALECLADLISKSGKQAPQSPHIPRTATVTTLDAFKERAQARGLLDGANPRDQWRELLKGLSASGLMGRESELVWVVPE